MYMPDKTIQPFEGQVVVENGILRSDVREFDGLPAFSELENGKLYYVHAEYCSDDVVIMRSYQTLTAAGDELKD